MGTAVPASSRHLCASFCLSLHLALCLSSAAPYSFLLHGDWGWIGVNQTAIAAQMATYADAIDAKFVVALGDNFYVDGIKNVSDPLWNTAFHDVYSAASLQVPWYPILGNHDYHVNVQAQIDRSYLAGEDVWSFPANYYVHSYALGDGGRMSIVYIDTQVLEPLHDDTTIIFQNPNWEQARQEHLEWIDYTLEEESRSATWLVVAGHYPIYSVGVNCDSEVLMASLLPLLLKHGVHMYVAGHDHNHQWTEMPDGVVYVVSGQSGGRGPFGHEGVRCMGTSHATDYIHSYFSECGFAFAEVTSKEFSMSFVNADGDVKFTGKMTNPHGTAGGGLLGMVLQVFGDQTAALTLLAACGVMMALAVALVLYSRQLSQREVENTSDYITDDSTRSTFGLTANMDRSSSRI